MIDRTQAVTRSPEFSERSPQSERLQIQSAFFSHGFAALFNELQGPFQECRTLVLTESKDDRPNARLNTRPEAAQKHFHEDGASG